MLAPAATGATSSAPAAGTEDSSGVAGVPITPDQPGALKPWHAPTEKVSPAVAGYSIQGTVIAQGAGPLAGIYVEADSMTSGNYAYAWTAGGGGYSIDGLAPDTYAIWFIDPNGIYFDGLYSGGGVPGTSSTMVTVRIATATVTGINAQLVPIGPWTLTLQASAASAGVGVPVTITSTASYDLGLTNYNVYIVADDGFAWYCQVGATCYVEDSRNSQGSMTYHAFVAKDYSGTATQVTSNSVTVTWTPVPGATYHPVPPARVLDTRDGTGGLSGPFSSHVARSFQVTGHGGVPGNATAVTGNLTITQQTSLGFLYIGPNQANNPTSSTLNFPVADDRANAVTVALGSGGVLWVTYAAPTYGPTAHVIFDVTGYFTADTTGATYHALNPTRLLDSRYGAALSGAFLSHVARCFQVAGGSSPVPAGGTAVTGNLTVTQQTSRGFLYIGPVAMNNPTSSTLNFPIKDDRANAVTVALGAGGVLCATFAAPTYGPTAHVIFDVTGYFTADTTGATFVPLNPTRLLDSRYDYGFTGAAGSHHAKLFGVVATHGGLPPEAIALTGNLTVTQQSSGGFLYIGPMQADNPTSSTLNFPVGDDRANAVDVAIGNGGLWVTYAAPTYGPTAHVIFDVSGYFAPYSHSLSLSPDYANIAAGTGQTYLATINGSDVTGHSTFSIVAGIGGVTSGSSTYGAGSPVPGASCSGAVCTAVLVGAYSVTATDVIDGAGTSQPATLEVGPAPAASLAITGLASSESPGVADAGMVVTAYDAYGNVATSFADPISFSSSDVLASVPPEYTFTVEDYGVHHFTTPNVVVFQTAGTQSITVLDELGSVTPGARSGITVSGTPVSSTYHSLTPARILDSRSGTGLSGAFSSHVGRTFQVTGTGGVPSGAAAVTGNLTVTQQTSAGILYIGPNSVNDPTVSMLNFTTGDDKANAVTVTLGSGGSLSVTYAAPGLGPTAHVIFDVTGYFTPDTTGATYHPLTPTVVLDSRSGVGLTGTFSSHVARTFQVTGGTGGVPSSAVAVTGYLAVTQQSSPGFLYIGPTAANNPTSSNLNFPTGISRGNGVAVALGAGGTLSATYCAASVGQSAQIVFVVTGYFAP